MEQTMAKAEQTTFWEGEFGVEYTKRNLNEGIERQGFYKKILALTGNLESALELGANVGHNLEALYRLAPGMQLTGVEVNKLACEQMGAKEGIKAVCQTIQEFDSPKKFSLVLICGVMIHLPPQDLPAVYKKMFDLSEKYVLINEYFNPVPIEIEYRGHAQRLFKRDFGSEFLDAVNNEVELVDYGFLWRRVEPAWDDTTWWLFKKK
jgi:spore coat polysaccharide biosynthesis protein SpsF